MAASPTSLAFDVFLLNLEELFDFLGRSTAWMDLRARDDAFHFFAAELTDQYGITNNEIRAACEKRDIPIPHGFELKECHGCQQETDSNEECFRCSGFICEKCTHTAPQYQVRLFCPDCWEFLNMRPDSEIRLSVVQRKPNGSLKEIGAYTYKVDTTVATLNDLLEKIHQLFQFRPTELLNRNELINCRAPEILGKRLCDLGILHTDTLQFNSLPLV